MKMTEEIFSKIRDYIPIGSWYGKGCMSNTKLILTGSALLCAYGLMDEFEDVDIIVADSDKSYWSELLHTHNISLEEAHYESIKIESNGFVYNIIRDDSYFVKSDATKITLDGELYLDSLLHAISAKKRLDREKDKLHFCLINVRLEALRGKEVQP